MKLRATSGITRVHIVALLILLGLTMFVPIPVVSGVPVPPIVPYPHGPFEKYGPRVWDLVFTIWGDQISEAIALENGEIDVMWSLVPASYEEAWLADPNITMGEVDGLGYFAHRTYYGTHPGGEVFEGLEWEGFVHTLGGGFSAVGFSNFWTHLNAHPQSFARGGMLRQGLINDISSFNPLRYHTPSDWLVLQQIYEPLIAYHPLVGGEFVSILAQDVPEELTWEFDGETCPRLRFELCPNILWHDAMLLTVEDVAFSFTYMRDEDYHHFPMSFYADYITSANGSGWWGPQLPKDTIDILFNATMENAPERASWVPIIPKHIWEGKDSRTWNPENDDAVIGSGPFRCNKDGVVGRPDHLLGLHIHLEANPFYHRIYITPDATNSVYGVMTRDGVVTRADFVIITWPDHLFTYDPRLYPLLPPWDPNWMNTTTGDHYLDVNKDGIIDLDDLVWILAKYGRDWPPPWYE